MKPGVIFEGKLVSLNSVLQTYLLPSCIVYHVSSESLINQSITHKPPPRLGGIQDGCNSCCSHHQMELIAPEIVVKLISLLIVVYFSFVNSCIFV